MPSVDITLAGSPTTWGVDFAGSPDNPPWQRVLDEIASSGLRALELGPVGYLPENPEVMRHELATRELTAVGSFVFESLHDPGHLEHVLIVAERACRAIKAAGGTTLVIIDRPGRERAATAGRSEAARRLAPSGWSALLTAVNAVAEVARRHGLTAAFHPHAGSYIEFEDEIDRLLSDTEISLCLDTGHAAYAGIDPPEAIANYAARLRHLHLKDVDPRVLARARDQRLGFWAAIEAGVFCPLGAGTVDLEQLAAALREAGYRGYATIEQDRVPGTGTPLEDLRASLRMLAGGGIGAKPRAAGLTDARG